MRDKKNFLIVLSSILLLAISFGYVSYSTKNNQTSTSKEISKWDVEITNVEVFTNGDAEDNNYIFKEGTLVLKPILRTVNDTIVYMVTIKNKGTIPATLGRYVYNEKDKASAIIFAHNVPKEELQPNEETTVELNVRLDENKFEDGIEYTNDLTAIYEYIQKK